MKKKWKVRLPQPSAVRLVKRKLTIHVFDGWGLDDREVVGVSPDVVEYEFELDSQFAPLRESEIVDGFAFTVHLSFANATGTREETVELQPEAVR